MHRTDCLQLLRSQCQPVPHQTLPTAHVDDHYHRIVRDSARSLEPPNHPPFIPLLSCYLQQLGPLLPAVIHHHCCPPALTCSFTATCVVGGNHRPRRSSNRRCYRALSRPNLECRRPTCASYASCCTVLWKIQVPCCCR